MITPKIATIVMSLLIATFTFAQKEDSAKQVDDLILVTPSAHSIMIKTMNPGCELTWVKIIDSSGALKLNKEITDNNYELSTTSIENGTYWLFIYSKSNKVVSQIMIISN